VRGRADSAISIHRATSSRASASAFGTGFVTAIGPFTLAGMTFSTAGDLCDDGPIDKCEVCIVPETDLRPATGPSLSETIQLCGVPVAVTSAPGSAAIISLRHLTLSP
jgi:hypothetical protein